MTFSTASNGLRTCGRKRLSGKRILKSSSTRCVPGRNRQQRKQARKGKAKNKRGQSSKKSSEKSVLSFCLKKERARQQKSPSKTSFVKTSEFGSNCVKSWIPGKARKSDSRKFGKRWDSKRMHEERKVKRELRAEKEEIRNAHQRAKDQLRFERNHNPDGSKIMFCLFFVLRQILDFSSDSSNYWGMNYIFFPNHLANLREAVNFIHSRGCMERFIENSNKKRIYYLVSSYDSDENHVSLEPFPGCAESSFSEFYWSCHDLPFYSTDPEASEIIAGDDLGLAENEIDLVAQMMANLVWSESHKVKATELAPAFDKMSDISSEDSFMVTKKLYYDIINFLKFKPRYRIINKSGLDFSVLEYSVILVSYCRQNEVSRPLAEIGFDAVSEKFGELLMSLVLGLSKVGKKTVSMLFDSHLAVEARAKRSLFRADIEYLLPLFRVKEPFGHLGPATWKRFYLGRIQTAAIKFSINKLAAHMTPPSTWDLEKAKSFMPPPARRELYKNKNYYKPLPALFESEEEAADDSEAESVTSSLEDLHNSETPVNPFTLLRESAVADEMVDFDSLEKILLKMKGSNDESEKEIPMTMSEWLATSMDVELPNTSDIASSSPKSRNDVSSSLKENSDVASQNSNNESLGSFGDREGDHTADLEEDRELDWNPSAAQDDDSDEEKMDPMAMMMKFNFSSNEEPFVPPHLRDEEEHSPDLVEHGDTSIRKPSLILENVHFDDMVSQDKEDYSDQKKPDDYDAELLKFVIEDLNPGTDEVEIDPSELHGSCGHDCAPDGFKSMTKWIRFFGEERFKAGWFTSSELAAFYNSFDQVFAVVNDDQSLQFPGFSPDEDQSRSVITYHFSGSIESGHWYKSQIRRILFKKKCDHGSSFACPFDCKCTCKNLRCKNRRTLAYYVPADHYKTENSFSEYLAQQSGSKNANELLPKDSAPEKNSASIAATPAPEEMIQTTIFCPELSSSFSEFTLYDVSRQPVTVFKVDQIKDQLVSRHLENFFEKVTRAARDLNENIINKKLRCKTCSSKAVMGIWMHTENGFKLALMCRKCCVSFFIAKTALGKYDLSIHSVVEVSHFGTDKLMKKVVFSQFGGKTLSFDLDEPIMKQDCFVCFSCKSSWIFSDNMSEPCENCLKLVKSESLELRDKLTRIYESFDLDKEFWFNNFISFMEKDHINQIRDRSTKSPFKLLPEGPECFNCKNICNVCFTISSTQNPSETRQILTCNLCSLLVLTKVVLGEIKAIDLVANSYREWFKLDHIERIWPETRKVIYISESNVIMEAHVDQASATVPNSQGNVVDLPRISAEHHQNSEISDTPGELPIETTSPGIRSVNSWCASDENGTRTEQKDTPLMQTLETELVSNHSIELVQKETESSFEEEPFVSYFSLENLKKVFPRGNVTSQTTTELQSEAQVYMLTGKASACLSKLLNNSQLNELKSNTVGELYKVLSEPKKILFFRFGAHALDEANHVSSMKFENGVPMMMSEVVASGKISWNLYSEESIVTSHTTVEAPLESSESEKSGEEDWLNLTNVTKLDDLEIKSSAALILQYVEIESSPKHFKIIGKIEEAMSRISAMVSSLDAVSATTAVNFYVALLLSSMFGSVSKNNLMKPGTKLNKMSAEIVDSVMHTLIVTYSGTFHEPNLTELAIELYEACSNDQISEEINLVPVIDLRDSEFQERINVALKSPFQSMKKAAEKSITDGSTELAKIVLDTNLIIWAFETGIVATLPFDLICFKPIFNEIIRLNQTMREMNGVSLMQFYMNLLRVNRFILHLSEDQKAIGDEHILSELTLFESIKVILLTGDKKLSEIAEASGCHVQLMTRTAWKDFIKKLSSFPNVISKDWVTCFGLKTVVVDEKGDIYTNSDRDVPFFNVEANSINTKRKLPSLSRLNDLEFDSEIYETLFLKHRESLYSKFILDDSKLEASLNDYDESLINKCKDEEAIFTETRGERMVNMVADLDESSTYMRQLNKAKSAFEASCKLRNKPMPNFVDCYSTPSKSRDSCWPSELERIEESHRTISDVCVATIPGFLRIFRKADLPSWATKFDANPLKIQRWKENSARTLKNTGIVQMEGYQSEESFKYYSSCDNPDELFTPFEVSLRDAQVVGDAPIMDSIREGLFYEGSKIMDCSVIERYSWLLNHLIHDIVNISVSTGRVYINDNNLVNVFYIIGPGARNRTVHSKRGVRFCFVVDSKKTFKGFYPEFKWPLRSSDNSTISGVSLMISRYYYLGVEDLIWKSRLWTNFTLPRLKSLDPVSLTGLYWTMFHSSSNVKKLLSFFKYFNVVSLSTFSKLDGLIDKYLQILPKRESEVWLWRRVTKVMKSVIVDNEPQTILGEAFDLPDYLEKNNLYTMPRPQTTSSTHDYQMMYRDISSNISTRETASLRTLFSKVYDEKKHISASVWQNSVKAYAKHFPHFSSKELATCMSKDFLPFFVTNSNGVDPDRWRKSKNAIIFSQVLSQFEKSSSSGATVDNTIFVPHFLNFCLNKLEERGPFAFISIKPQKDAADREIVVQDFYTKAGHYAMQAIFKHLSSKWEGELVSKSTYDKYSFISRMKFDEKTFFINDDMAKWSPQDLNEKFEFLINLLDHYAILPPEMIGLLVRSFRLTKNVVLLFDERLRDPSLKWYRPEDLMGNYNDGVLSDSVKARPWRNPSQRAESTSAKENLFSPLVMSFGWPQGLKHFISSFAHGLATIYTERVITKVLGYGTLVQSGFHSDDKNTAITIMKGELEDNEKMKIVLNLSDKSVRPFCLGQSKTKSSVSVFATHLKFRREVRARKVSELVSVYNVEGTILDSYFRQSSNLTAGFTYPTFVENHYSLITRCCSIFNLSNRIFEPEIIYNEILKYLELFFGKDHIESAATLSYGSRKKVPIYLIAEYGFAADNVWSVLRNFDKSMSELKDYLVIKSMKNLSESGKKFKEKVENTVSAESIVDIKAAKSLLSSEAHRMIKPVSGVFNKDKDESLNNLFRFKNEPLYVNWSSFKKSLFNDSSDLGEASYMKLNEVVKKVQDNLPLTPYVDETVVATEALYVEILCRLLDDYDVEINAEPDLSGIMTRKSVRSELSLSNDFVECLFLAEHGMNARHSFRLRLKWNSLIDDLEKFVSTHRVKTLDELKSMNSIWDQVKKSSVDRNPVFLLYKGKESFTDVKLKLRTKRFDAKSKTFSEKKDGPPIVLQNWVKGRLVLKKTSEYKARHFESLISLNLNKMIFDTELKLPASFMVTETDWVRQLKNELFDKPSQLRSYSRFAKSLKSYITGEMEEFRPNEIVLIAVENEGTPESTFYYECVGNTNVYFKKTRSGVYANVEAYEEHLQIARKHFRIMPSIDDQLSNIMNTRLADKKFRMGYVRKIEVRANEKGFLSCHVTSSTGALAGRTTSYPLLLKDSEMPGDPFRDKMRSAELSSNSILIHKFDSDNVVDESPDEIFESISDIDYVRVAHKVNKALGTVQRSFNLRFCDFNENPIGTFNHSACHLNTGDVVYCMKEQKFNKFFKARMKMLSSDMVSDFKEIYLSQDNSVSEQLKIYKKRNLISFCHKSNHLGGGDYLNYLAFKSGKLSKKTLNWVINLLSGRGFIILDQTNNGFLGFSWEMISALAKAKLVNLKSVKEINDSNLLEAVLPSHAHQPLDFVSNLQYACRIPSHLKKWLEHNQSLLEPEVQFASIIDPDTAEGFRIQNQEVMKLTDATTDYGVNYLNRIGGSLDEQLALEFAELKNKVSETKGGMKAYHLRKLREWASSVLSSSPELQLDYQLIGRKFSDSMSSKLAVVDLDQNIIIFRQIPGLAPDIELEIAIIEQLKPIKSGSVPLTFNYSNYSEFAATFDPQDLVDLWKERIDNYLDDELDGFETLSKQLKSIVQLEKTFDLDHLESANFQSFGFSKETAKHVVNSLFLTKRVFLPDYESFHKIRVITKPSQFEDHFSLNPVEFDENFAQNSSKNISILNKSMKNLDKDLIEEIINDSLTGQIVASRLKNDEDPKEVSRDLMETDFSKIVTGLKSMNPGNLKKTIKITDSGFKTTSKIWIFEKSALSEFHGAFGTMREKEDLIMLWSLIKAKPGKNNEDIKLLNSVSLAISLSPDLLTNNRLKSLFGNPINWKRHMGRMSEFWRTRVIGNDELSQFDLLNPDLINLAKKNSVL
uniref:RNA-directed RNA polymerase L n=1 Tax=Rhizoctonia cerealis bunyavirus TaxID=3068840 RepID=A0AA51BSE2_9VIRU|nr:MAG: RNA-dependent RNA polymerase [Rhizoctonia cerealis bunyavirus]